MTIGVVGRKCGMTRVFTDDGVSVPVTVIEATPNHVTDVRSNERNGYRAVQVACGEVKVSRMNKAMRGHYAKTSTEPARVLREFRLDEKEGEDLQTGSELKVDLFEEGQYVDVTGTSIGKGFAGAVKRHNFRMQDATHGNSLSHRAPGSIGQCQTPGRVFKGKKMSGHMGAVQRTAQNLKVIKVDAERNLILVRGAVPGSKGGDVVVCPAVKRRG